MTENNPFENVSTANTYAYAEVPLAHPAAPTPAPPQEPFTYGYQPPVSAAAVEPPIDQPWYGIGFGGAIKRFFQKYATFSGRASRGEYWFIYLATMLLNAILSALELIPILGDVLALVAFFGLIVPTLAVQVRRLHDANFSGWFIAIPYGALGVGGFIYLIGYILDPLGPSGTTWLLAFLLFAAGAITLIVFLALPTKPEGARFDKNPSPSPTFQAQPTYSQQPTYTQHSYTQQQAYTQQSYTQSQYSQQAPVQQRPAVQQQSPAQPIQRPQTPIQQQPVQQYPMQNQPHNHLTLPCNNEST